MSKVGKGLAATGRSAFYQGGCFERGSAEGCERGGRLGVCLRTWMAVVISTDGCESGKDV